MLELKKNIGVWYDVNGQLCVSDDEEQDKSNAKEESNSKDKSKGKKRKNTVDQGANEKKEKTTDSKD